MEEAVRSLASPFWGHRQQHRRCGEARGQTDGWCGLYTPPCVSLLSPGSLTWLWPGHLRRLRKFLLGNSSGPPGWAGAGGVAAPAARCLPPLLFPLHPPACVPGPWSGCRASWAPGPEGPHHASVCFCGSQRAVSMSPDSPGGETASSQWQELNLPSAVRSNHGLADCLALRVRRSGSGF